MTARVHIRRRRVLLSVLIIFTLAIVARAFQVQVVQGADWETRAERQHRQRLELPAPRGVIYDRNGTPLATSREVFRVAVAPRELTDPDAVAAQLRDVLGIPAGTARRAVDPSDPWFVLPGRYDATLQDELAGVPGIYFERIVERFYPYGELGLELLGRVGATGAALGGMELALDSVLAGRAGVAVVRRDAGGRPIPGAMMTVVEPKAGGDVHLTIDHTLQEIAHEALAEAVEETEAEGGDLVLADPRTGEILAAASRRRSGGRYWWGVTEPYEPGSTLKPFTVAALLAEGRARMTDTVYAEQGRYTEGGRTITDVEEHEWLSVHDALRLSSNIAMAKLAQRVEPAQQYRYLRDFGFGTATGLPYPSESPGVLRRPASWSGYTQSSLAIGYEIAVTPLQMTMAYAALANGGVLLEPRLISSVRSRDGRGARTSEPRALRRVVPPEVARAVTAALVDVVEQGTGTLAALGGFRVAGKTGTARRVDGGAYGDGYTASFAGFFPAAAPQLVFLVKLDRPRGASYYGGVTAAPVMRRLLEAVLAARHGPLDAGAVASTPPIVTRAADRSGMRAALLPALTSARAPRGMPAAPVSEPVVFSLREGSRPAAERLDERPAEKTVPDVRGLPIRDAIWRLHTSGFQVRIDGDGRVHSTRPAPGRSAPAGSVIRVLGGESAAASDGADRQ